MKTKIFILMMMLIGVSVNMLFAQKENRMIRQGNREFEKKQYDAAETSYIKAIEANPASVSATYNLAETRYRQDSLNQAVKHWSATAWNQAVDSNIRANSFYNIGNTMMKAEDYQKSIELYKQALRVNPNDEDARYNLAYAQQKLRQQQDQQQNGGKNDKQQNNDKNQDQQNQQDQQQQNQQDQQNQQNTQNQQQNQQQQAQSQQEISKEEAERMLEAMKNNEKKTLEKVIQQQVGKPQKTDKDW
jgi:tetratricopeptide (TPR) repeat protein